jgi:hypothetical protein
MITLPQGMVMTTIDAAQSYYMKQLAARRYINDCPFRRALNRRWRVLFHRRQWAEIVEFPND